MRKDFLLPLLLAFLLNGISHAATNVSGNITADTTWTRSNSPYLITETVEVLPGATLTIEPGVTVRFILKFLRPTRPTTLLVRGQLIAEGTENATITFTSNRRAVWVLKFVAGAQGSILDENGEYVSGSIIKYCKIKWGWIESEVGLYIGYSTIIPGIMFRLEGMGECVGITLKGNTIRSVHKAIEIYNFYTSTDLPCSIINIVNNRITALYDDAVSVMLDGHPTCSITVTGNTIENSLGAGLKIGVKGETTGVIAENTITHNKGCGILFYWWFTFATGPVDAVISRNIISNNNCGIDLGWSSEENVFYINGNTISDNSGGAIGIPGNATCTVTENNLTNNGEYDIDNGTPNDITAMNNWWGTTDISEIEQRIFDYYDDIENGKVLFEPIAETPFPTPEIPLTAAFSATPLTGNAPLTVQFTDESFGTVTSWLWDFGTETTASEPNPTYTFTDPGTFTVSLTASNESVYDTETKTAYITVLRCGDYNGDNVLNLDDLFDKREDLLQEEVTWQETCWSPRETCGDYNDDGAVNLSDWYDKRVSLSQEFKTWTEECWLAEDINPTEIEIAEELMEEFSESHADATLPFDMSLIPE